MWGPVDVGHVILGAALVIVITSRLRRQHRSRFGLTFTIRRHTDDDESVVRDRQADTDDDAPQ